MEYEFKNPFYKDIIISKYCHAKGEGREEINEGIKRVASHTNKFDEEQSQQMEDYTIEYMSSKEYSPAGGIWRAAGNPKKKISAVNCTTQEPVKDNLESLGKSKYWWAKIASYGQGNGICIDGLRPRDAAVGNCAHTSTGAVSFLHTYDAEMQVIGQGNRRGATKPDISVYHPDAQEFINCKKDDVDILTSQNQSVKVDNDFMFAVENDLSFLQGWKRKDNKVYVGENFLHEDEGPDIQVKRESSACEMFDEIVTAAWTTGEPGLEIWDLSQKLSNSDYHPDKKYHIVSTNGCSEQKLDPWNTCILSSINLSKMPLIETDIPSFEENEKEYVDKTFRNLKWVHWLQERVKFGMRHLDNVVEMELQEERSPHPEQRAKLRDMTRVGLGFTGLADWFIKNKIVYGSEESVKILDEIMKVFSETAYRENIALGKERGSFNEFGDGDWYRSSAFIKQLCDNTNLNVEEITHARFVCCLTIAPTGTLSMVVEADGSGCEPMFAPYNYRKERATTGEYTETFVWSNLIREIATQEGWELTKEKVDAYIKDKPEWIFANDVEVKTKIDLMSAMYLYIDSGVAVTYNLPSTATKEDVRDVFMYAWKKKLKSVTVYRDGCRQGVLTHTATQDGNIVKHEAPTRPKELPCDVHQISVQHNKWVVLVGLMGEDPYEVFACLQDAVELPTKIKDGTVLKSGKKYFLIDNGYKIDIKEAFKNLPSESAITRLISAGLRHGTDIKYIVNQLDKSEGTIVSFSKAIARVLKKYIKDGEVNGEACHVCKSENMLRQSGCLTCGDCGWSKC